MSLLYALDQYLQTTLERNGRTSFTLHILFVAEDLGSDEDFEGDALHSVQQRFPLHSYSICHLKDIFRYSDIEVGDIIQLGAQDDENSRISHQDKLKHLLSTLPSASSRADVIATLRGRLISSFAQRHCCFGIIYGDSTTRLAERTLAETAKGRGGSLPWLTADGMSPFGTRVYYPMRDMLKKELSMYAELTDPPLTPLVKTEKLPIQGPISSKDTTIDGLMSQYFSSVEENYPNIVANVVRTSGRLIGPSTENSLETCRICGLPVDDSARGWAGHQELPSLINGTAIPIEHTSPLCYGCLRAVG